MAMKSNLNPKFISVYVSGRVESPGEKKVTRLSTVQDAIVLSGGTKALKGKINLIRLNQNGELEKLKISSNKRKRGSKNNPYLKDGDIIYIGKSPFNITSEILGSIM
jgi:polysaccharide export outer membrane protein